MSNNLDPNFYTRNLVNPQATADELGIRVATLEPGPQRITPPLFWQADVDNPLVVVERQELENDTNLLIWYGVIKIMLAWEGLPCDAEDLDKLLRDFALGRPQLRVVEGGAS